MLSKIFFTLVVIIGVVLFYRNKRMREQPANPAPSAQEAEGPLSTHTLAYIMIGILVAISGAVFAYNWHQNNRIVNIQVTSEGNEVVHYQARHGDIKKRVFITLDGVQVTLGQNDRMEIPQQ